MTARADASGSAAFDSRGDGRGAVGLFLLAAMINAAPFYWPNWPFYLLLSPAWAVDAVFLFHFLLAGLGAVLYLRGMGLGRAAIVAGAGPAVAEDGGPGHLRWHRPSPCELMVDLEVRRPCLLVQREQHYPGWEATVDGRPRPLVPVDRCMRAVPVRPGDRRCTLRFRSRSLRLGLAFSAAALVLSLAWLARAEG